MGQEIKEGAVERARTSCWSGFLVVGEDLALRTGFLVEE
jgi:hypothetical protein